MRRIRGFVRLLLSTSPILLGGCLYKFSGGGLPPGIHTVAVLPFDNLTPEPTLTQEVTQAVREAVQNRLGLRGVGEGQADAIVKGTIQQYQPDLPLAFTGSTSTTQPVNVTKRMVQITVNVEMRGRDRDGGCVGHFAFPRSSDAALCGAAMARRKLTLAGAEDCVLNVWGVGYRLLAAHEPAAA